MFLKPGTIAFRICQFQEDRETSLEVMACVEDLRKKLIKWWIFGKRIFLAFAMGFGEIYLRRLYPVMDEVLFFKICRNILENFHH